MIIGRISALNVEKERFMLFNAGINPKSRYSCAVGGFFVGYGQLYRNRWLR
jgi:hypothetical protein